MYEKIREGADGKEGLRQHFLCQGGAFRGKAAFVHQQHVAGNGGRQASGKEPVKEIFQ